MIKVENILFDIIMGFTYEIGSFIKVIVEIFPKCKLIFGFGMNNNYIDIFNNGTID